MHFLGQAVGGGVEAKFAQKGFQGKGIGKSNSSAAKNDRLPSGYDYSSLATSTFMSGAVPGAVENFMIPAGKASSAQTKNDSMSPNLHKAKGRGKGKGRGKDTSKNGKSPAVRAGAQQIFGPKGKGKGAARFNPNQSGKNGIQEFGFNPTQWKKGGKMKMKGKGKAGKKGKVKRGKGGANKGKGTKRGKSFQFKQGY